MIPAHFATRHPMTRKDSRLCLNLPVDKTGCNHSCAIVPELPPGSVVGLAPAGRTPSNHRTTTLPCLVSKHVNSLAAGLTGTAVQRSQLRDCRRERIVESGRLMITVSRICVRVQYMMYSSNMTAQDDQSGYLRIHPSQFCTCFDR